MTNPGYNKLTPLMAARLAAPHTWPGPAVLTTAFGGLYSIAQGWPFEPLVWVLLLIVAVFAQSAVNTLNDYADFKAGTDTADNSDDPTDAVLVFDNPNPSSVLKLGIAYMAVAAIAGLAATWWSGGVMPLIMGALGALFVVVYSWGKLPISYLPLGELVSGVVMGCLIPLAGICVFAGHWLNGGDVFALTGSLDWIGALMQTAPFVIGIALVMMTQNTCDIERDEPIGRKTLPVVVGRKRAVIIYRALVILWIAAVLHFAFWGYGTGFWIAPVVLVLGFGTIRQILITPLTHEVRGPSMGAITKGNLFINGAFIMAIMVSLI